MRARSWSVLVVFLSPLVSVPAAAQRLEPGQRIRVTAPEIPLARETGLLVSLDAATLAFDGATQRWSVPRHLVTRLEASQGRKGHLLTGLLVGAGVGIVAGFIAIEGGSSSMCSGSGDYARNCWFVMGGATALGALLGGGTGALIRTERWVVVPLDAPVAPMP